jgi:hypothetical protein
LGPGIRDDEKFFLLRLSRPMPGAVNQGGAEDLTAGKACHCPSCPAFTEFNKASSGPTARVDVISPYSVPRKDEARPTQSPAGLLISLSPLFLSLSQTSRECTPDCTCTHAPDDQQQYSIRFIGLYSSRKCVYADVFRGPFAMEQRVVYFTYNLQAICQMHSKLISI